MTKRKVDYSNFDFTLFSDELLEELEREARKTGDRDFANAIRDELKRRKQQPQTKPFGEG